MNSKAVNRRGRYVRRHTRRVRQRNTEIVIEAYQEKADRRLAKTIESKTQHQLPLPFVSVTKSEKDEK